MYAQKNSQAISQHKVLEQHKTHIRSAIIEENLSSKNLLKVHTIIQTIIKYLHHYSYIRGEGEIKGVSLYFQIMTS